MGERGVLWKPEIPRVNSADLEELTRSNKYTRLNREKKVNELGVCWSLTIGCGVPGSHMVPEHWERGLLGRDKVTDSEETGENGREMACGHPQIK